jgi:hypothetical protein
VIDACFAELEPLVGTVGACRGSGKSRATHYRRCQPKKYGPAQPRSTPANALSEEETTELLALLRSPRLWTWPRPRCGPSPSTKATIWPQFRPCTGYCGPRRSPRATSSGQASDPGPTRVDGRSTQYVLVVGYRAPRGAFEPRGGARTPPSVRRSGLRGCRETCPSAITPRPVRSIGVGAGGNGQPRRSLR